MDADYLFELLLVTATMVLATPFVLVKHRRFPVVIIQYVFFCAALVTLILLFAKGILTPVWFSASCYTVMGIMLICGGMPALNPERSPRFPEWRRILYLVGGVGLILLAIHEVVEDYYS
jgi:hypothetical protein